MENEILKKLEESDQKIDEIYKSVEKTRKYFLWMLIITLAVFILPLVALLFIVPSSTWIITMFLSKCWVGLREKRRSSVLYSNSSKTRQ